MNLGLTWRDLAGPIGIGAAVLFAILFVRSCNRADSAESELRRERDAAKLTDAGMPPEVPVDAKALKTELEAAEREGAAFKAALDDVRAKLKAAGEKPPKIVEVVRYVTKPGAAGGVTEGGGGAREQPCSSCLVSPGDTMQIQVSEATLETKSGNRIVTGSAACRRLDPKPETTIYEAPIAMNLTRGATLEVKGVASRRPWIAGVIGATNGSSWGIGPSVGYAGSHAILTLGGTFGGESQAIASIHGRF